MKGNKATCRDMLLPTVNILKNGCPVMCTINEQEANGGAAIPLGCRLRTKALETVEPPCQAEPSDSVIEGCERSGSSAPSGIIEWIDSHHCGTVGLAGC
jgi:hypothetical protein